MSKEVPCIILIDDARGRNFNAVWAFTYAVAPSVPLLTVSNLNSSAIADAIGYEQAEQRKKDSTATLSISGVISIGYEVQEIYPLITPLAKGKNVIYLNFENVTDGQFKKTDREHITKLARQLSLRE